MGGGGREPRSLGRLIRRKIGNGFQLLFLGPEAVVFKHRGEMRESDPEIDLRHQVSLRGLIPGRLPLVERSRQNSYALRISRFI